VRGEECLVAHFRVKANEVGYRLCTIDPQPGSTG